MADTSSILQAVAVPMSHTPTGILKVEIMGTLLVVGVLVATYGFRRWYYMVYEDWLLSKRKEELIEQRQSLFQDIGKDPKGESLTEEQKWMLVDKKIPFNEEDYEPPLRSHIVNYIFIGLGVFLAAGGVITWLVIPA